MADNDHDIASAGKRLIIAEGLYKSFNNSGSTIDILKDAHFEVEAGETIAVVGASGIGKSTFLHILGTLDRPDAGDIIFGGENVLRFDDVKLAKHRNDHIGFVFQFHHLLPEFTALENAMMPALIRGMNREKAKNAAEEILNRVGLQHRLLHQVTDLSGGEQQRVALARALVLKPQVLLADEPTGNLDRKNSEQIHRLLLELNEEYGVTLVVVTHNTELAEFMSRRVTIVDGKLVKTN